MKKQTRGRKTIPILESIPYSNIIFLISSGVDYPEAISKARKTNSSSTVKQLAVLRKTGFLNEPKKEKLLNKTRHSVNFDKILEGYLSHCLDIYKIEGVKTENNFKKSSFIPHDKVKKISLVKNDELTFSKREKTEITNNEHLRFSIKSFCITESLTKDSTITNIFERMNSLILNNKEILLKLESQNNSMRKFIELLRNINAESFGIQKELIEELLESKLTNKKLKMKHPNSLPNSVGLLGGIYKMKLLEEIEKNEWNKEYLKSIN